MHLRPIEKQECYCFNRYMVECEFFYPHFLFSLVFVLIDTWWNVNTNKLGAGVDAVGFNRYMVECEFVEFTNITRIGNAF